VRISIDGVFEEVLTDSAVIQERIALARSPVSDDDLAVALCGNQELQKPPFRFANLLLEIPVVRDRRSSYLSLVIEQTLCPVRYLAISRFARIDSQGTSVRSELLDVEDGQAVVIEYSADGRKREIGKVLVIDRIELIVFHQPDEMGEFHRDHPVISHQRCEAVDEIVQVRHMGEDIVAQDEIGPAAFVHDVSCGLPPEKPRPGFNAPLPRIRGDAVGGLDTEARDAFTDEVLQQIAVVTRNLDDEGIVIDPMILHHLVYILLRVLDPA
jgi:hypothetical protein